MGRWRARAFGRYQLIEVLGRGGMGEVWRAHDTEIDRVVALKMLLPQYAQDPEFDARFRREARAAARLDDPHIVPIYDVGEIDGRLYVTMRLIDGVDLQTVLNNGPLPPERAVHIIGQIASALHSAHQIGLVHRDVKPSNILLGPNDFAYLIDFGIARASGDPALTATSTTVGTWAYMAPERFNTGEIHPSSDIYALACVLFQCLTGNVPFPGDTLEQIAGGHMVAPPPRPSADGDTVPTAMDHVIATGLAKQPTDRFPSTVDLATAAQRAITEPTGRPYADPAYAQPWQSSAEAPTALAQIGAPPAANRPSRRPVVVIGALAAVALLIAGGVFAAVQFSRDDGPAATGSPGTAAAPPTSDGPPPNTGPFTGVYKADYGSITGLNDRPGPDRTRPSDTYAIRSACRPTGCVATASRLSGGTAFASPMVFDEVGKDWFAVGLGSVPCQNDPAAEMWEVLKLTPRPDGTLAGEYTATTSNDCVSKRTVTFTRTGDVDLESLPDPVTAAAARGVAGRGATRPVPPDENVSGNGPTTAGRLRGQNHLSTHRRSVHELLPRAGRRGATAPVRWRQMELAHRVRQCVSGRPDACEEDRAVPAAPTAAESDHSAHRTWPPGTEPALRGQRRIRRHLYAHRRLATSHSHRARPRVVGLLWQSGPSFTRSPLQRVRLVVIVSRWRAPHLADTS